MLADEPTANLDSKTGSEIIDLMRSMQQQQHVSFIFSSHDPKVLDAADDAVHIHDGRITAIERRLALPEARTGTRSRWHGATCCATAGVR